MKILIVDDEEMIREVIKEYCLEENYEVYESSSGIDALKMLKNNSFDLMVLDIMMPEMDGFTLLSKILFQGIKPKRMLKSAELQ